MKRALLSKSIVASAVALGVTAYAGAETVTSFAPSTNTDPGVWYESFVTSSGAADIVDLTGSGGDLETNQPLPVGAARLTTTADNGDRANVGIFDAYGTPDDIFSTLAISYSYHKASNGAQNLFAAPALKLAFFNAVCDDAGSAGDCFGTLVFEPTWNQPGFEGASVAPPLDTWQTFNIDENTGLFWWTGGFGEPNTAGGPPLRTLAQWKAAFTSDFGDSSLALIEIGVGSFNQNQLGYFDDVQISHTFGGGYSKSYDFEAPAVENLDTGETFATIQDAIDDADTLDGHTLELLVDDHTEGPQVHFTKSLTLQGGSPDTLHPSGDTGTVDDARGWFLIDAFTDVTFRDLIFDGSGFKIHTAIRSHGTLTIEDCEFTEIKYEESGPLYGGIGVQTFDATGPMRISDCAFSEMGRIGIFVWGPTLVERCTYTGKGIGDFLDYFMCVDSFGTSIGLATIEDCVVSGNRGVASVDDSTSAGILVTTFFGAGTEAEITGCTFTDNTTGIAAGFDAADAAVVVANFNNIAGNDFGVINQSTVSVVDAKDNWWGHASGPDDPPGSIPAINGFCAPVADIFNVNPPGDSVTDENVCYCPWAMVELGGPPSGDLVLSAGDCQDDAYPGETGYQIEVELHMLNLTTPTTGFQAFLSFPTGTLSYRGDLSAYTSVPFPLHIQDIATAEVAAGELRLDGSDSLGDPGTVVDSLLATLVFDVDVECGSPTVDFDLTQLFDSELSFEGTPIPTTLTDTDPFTLDDTPPILDPCPADITVASDASVGDGCQGATVSYTVPAATDDCGGVTVDCVPASGTFFAVGITEVTCTATDDCGNTSECTFDVEVTATNEVCVDVELLGVNIATSRCIHFVTDDCGSTADASLSFTDHDGDDANENGIVDATEGGSDDPSTPVRAIATVEVPCGNWTQLCAKDEAHTLWDTTDLSVDGDKYDADMLVSLEPGDTDNDGDVDINDVTLVILQFGGPEPSGGCPWDGTRGADFSNNGNVGSEDYSLLSGNWLDLTVCVCTTSFGPLGDRVELSIPSNEFIPADAKRLDVNADGMVDFRDVREFERKHGLPDTVSTNLMLKQQGWRDR